jgi:glutamate-1-semialdehyde 2,1-aminomutase
MARVGSMWTLFFTPDRVDDWTGAARADVARFARFFQAMLARGVVLAPSQFEANFISAAHTPGDIETTIAAAAAALETACA